MRLGDIDEDEIVLASDSVEEEESSKDKKEKNKSKAILSVVFDYLKVIVLGALIAFLISKFVIINAEVPSESMLHTIEVGDRLIGLRLTYYFGSPERGDIVIFKCPKQGEDYNKLYVKRVIGLPGETVEIKAGAVWIKTADGDYFMLQEDYLNETPRQDAAVNNMSYTVPEGSYFMMGDNRNNSDDSRYWGTVDEDRVLAKVLFRYYPGFEVLK